MSLAPGTRFGPYEIRAAIGAGGMGEVYRAHDSSLGRQVAIKVLPQRFAADRDRLARLEREARVLASLNHANIAAIHGLEESGSGPALVLELVEGPTLEERLLAGPLSIVDTLAIGRQIADALEAAHEQGIVHRDLKPANIKVRPDGTVKVLDFGIAKILEENGSDPGLAQAPTLTATKPGSLVGTTFYMSPEQARGEEVTRRADVWAFGAILFEMLTGARPFTGTTTADVLAAILRATPAWSALPPATPPAIARLVRRCLAREPKARLHDIGDARLEIEDVQRTLEAEPSAPAAARHDTPASASRRTAAIGLAIVVTLAAIAAAVYLRAPRDPAGGQEVRLEMPPPQGTHFVSVPAVSPDGRTIAFVAAPDSGGPGRMWIRPLAAAAAEEVPGSDGAIYPFWSADSRSIAFFADRTLKRLPVSGGNAVAVCAAEAGRGGLWLDDDTILFAPSPFSPLMRVNASGGQPAAFTTLTAEETGHRFPQRLPGRQLLYFSVNRTPEKSGSRIVSIADPDRPLSFIESIAVAEYVKGYVVFERSPSVSSVLAQRLTLPDGQPTGAPIEIGRARVSESLGRYVVSTAPTGVIVTLGSPEGVGQFTWMSRDGRVLATVGAPATQTGVELSPDGQNIATFRAGDIWAMSVERPVPNRVTHGSSRHPFWSPDGARIFSLFQGRGIGTFDLVTTTLATGSTETMLQGTSGVLKPVNWSRDGRTITWIDGTTRTLWTMPVEDPRRPVSLLDEGSQKGEGRLSPDERWIAYSTDGSGRFEVEVRSFPKAGPGYSVSVDGGGYPRWRADGKELFFVSPKGQIMSAAFSPGTPPTIGTPKPLFEVRLIAHPNREGFASYEYDVSRDGSRFLVNRLVSEPETSMAIIVDWSPPR